MADLIDRQALIAKWDESAEYARKRGMHEDARFFRAAIFQIRNELIAPTIDPESLRPTGEWVQVICHMEFEDGFVDRLYECCSRCHEPNGRRTSNFCPNCGTRMKEET